MQNHHSAHPESTTPPLAILFSTLDQGRLWKLSLGSVGIVLTSTSPLLAFDPSSDLSLVTPQPASEVAIAPLSSDWSIAPDVSGKPRLKLDALAPQTLSSPKQLYDASDRFEFRPLRSPTAPAAPAIAAPTPPTLAIPQPSAPSLSAPIGTQPRLLVPLQGLPLSSTPWEPGHNAPDPLAPPLVPFSPASSPVTLADPMNSMGGMGLPWDTESANTWGNPFSASNPQGGSAPIILVISDGTALPPEVQAWLGQYISTTAYAQGNPSLQNAPYALNPYAPPSLSQSGAGNDPYALNPYAPPSLSQSGAGTVYPPSQFKSQTIPLSVAPLSAAPVSAAPVSAVPIPVAPVPGIPVPVAPALPPPAPTPLGQPNLPVGQPGTNVPTPLSTPLPSELAPQRSSTGASLTLQGGVVLLDDEFSGRARVSGFYPISPDIALAGAVEVSEGSIFSDSELEGANINELHLTLAPRGVPNLRMRLGHLDLTSYFDRNSFAKDGLTHFFSPTLQTNPALAANGLGSRTGALVNYSVTDNIEARGVLFSSDRSISEFDLTGFGGELGFRAGNAIIRGTYISAIDGGSNDGPDEIFGFTRSDGTLGIAESDREESFGVNAELFIPSLNMGLFGRYGRYENQDADVSGETFSGGVSFLDVLGRGDRMGLGYGRSLSNNDLREARGEDVADVWELFYDFRLSPDVRLGFTVQQLDDFSETIAGVRLKTEFDIPSSP
ncbi:MAG: hypothetical protein AB4042_13465 [Leptolyngbyaceae cyanobacterium]